VQIDIEFKSVNVNEKLTEWFVVHELSGGVFKFITGPRE
jgi:hypothetical protein